MIMRFHSITNIFQIMRVKANIITKWPYNNITGSESAACEWRLRAFGFGTRTLYGKSFPIVSIISVIAMSNFSLST